MKTCVMLLAMLYYCAASAAVPSYGFVDVDAEDGAAHLYLSQRLSESDTLWLQWPDAQGRPQCCQSLQRGQLQESKNALGDEVSSKSGEVVHYLIQNLPGPLPDMSFTGIALSGDRVSALTPYHLQSSQHGITVSARLCFGVEGVNLMTEVDGRHDHLYLSFGYEIEQSPACTDEDFMTLDDAMPPVSTRLQPSGNGIRHFFLRAPGNINADMPATEGNFRIILAANQRF